MGSFPVRLPARQLNDTDVSTFYSLNASTLFDATEHSLYGTSGGEWNFVLAELELDVRLIEAGEILLLAWRTGGDFPVAIEHLGDKGETLGFRQVLRPLNKGHRAKRQKKRRGIENPTLWHGSGRHSRYRGFVPCRHTTAFWITPSYKGNVRVGLDADGGCIGGKDEPAGIVGNVFQANDFVPDEQVVVAQVYVLADFRIDRVNDGFLSQERAVGICRFL